MNYILRFITTGSVDDGKSTLIGRLLFDSHAVFQNQIEEIEKSGKKTEDNNIDLSILTDGLKSERQQGITIDVAYKYFNTNKRKFIIIDSPGHIQYTKNMVTGASNAEVAIILIDARHGVIEQTKRHFFICHLLGIKDFIVCINKMDLVNYSEAPFNEIKNNFLNYIEKTDSSISVKFIPICALKGDNVVHKSTLINWYHENSLLECLENIHLNEQDNNENIARFSVQYIIRPYDKNLHDYRGYAGKILSGKFKKDDDIIILPSGFKTKIKKIELFGSEIVESNSSQSVILHIQDDIDISRGDIISKADNQPNVGQEMEVDLCWMDNKPLIVGNKYILQQNSMVCQCLIKDILYKTKIENLEKDFNNKAFNLNDIGKVIIQTSKTITFDTYQKNKSTGCFVLIDSFLNNTVGACMISKKNN